MPAQATDETLSIAEAARALGIRQSDYVRRIVKTGALPADFVDGRWRIPVEAVEEYDRQRQERREAAEARREARAAEVTWTLPEDDPLKLALERLRAEEDGS
jgi:excisionase family DNA binding protein